MGTFHFVLRFHIAMPPRGFFSNGRFNQGNGNTVKNFSLDQNWEKLLVSGAKLEDGGLALYCWKVCGQLVINQCGLSCRLNIVRFHVKDSMECLSELHWSCNQAVVFDILGSTYLSPLFDKNSSTPKLK